LFVPCALKYSNYLYYSSVHIFIAHDFVLTSIMSAKAAKAKDLVKSLSQSLIQKSENRLLGGKLAL